MTYYGIMEEPSEEEVEAYEQNQKKLQENSSLACWLLTALTSLGHPVIEKQLFSPSSFRTIRLYLETLAPNKTLPVTHLLSALLKRVPFVKESSALIPELIELRASAIKEADVQYNDMREEASKSNVTEFPSQVLQGLALAASSVVNLLVGSVPRPLAAVFASAGVDLDSAPPLSARPSVWVWSPAALGSKVEIFTRPNIIRLREDSGIVEERTALATATLTAGMHKWSYKLEQFDGSCPLLGVAIVCAKEDGSDEPLSLSWTSNELHVMGCPPISFGPTLSRGDTVGVKVDIGVGLSGFKVWFYRNEALVGLALGPVGSGAAFEKTAKVRVCSPAVTLASKNDTVSIYEGISVTLKAREVDPAELDLTTPQWLSKLTQLVTLLHSFSVRKLPLQYLKSDVVALCEHHAQVVVETSHPYDASSGSVFEREVRIPHATSLTICIDPSTGVKDSDVVRIVGASGVPSEAVEVVGMKGLVANPGSTLGIAVGDTVVRGPDWDWGDQDGGIGCFGEVMEIKTWKGKLSTGDGLKIKVFHFILFNFRKERLWYCGTLEDRRVCRLVSLEFGRLV